MTAIQWTDETWNPVTGCSRVSEGCRHCYIERTPPFRMAGRKLGDPIQLHPDRLDQPLHWKKPRRVFVNSLSDLFHEDVPTDFIAKVFLAMNQTPQHAYQVLTKRPARMLEFSQECQRRQRVEGSWPMPNLWLGVSVEDQKTADERIPILLQTPATVRFVSYEPALGPVDLRRYLRRTEHVREFVSVGKIVARHVEGLDWVIAGGESGPGARPCDVAWIRSIVQQCKQAGVPVFVKQLGSQPRGWCVGIAYGDDPESSYENDYCDLYEASEIPKPCPGKCMEFVDRKGGSMCEWPEDLRVREWPK